MCNLFSANSGRFLAKLHDTPKRNKKHTRGEHTSNAASPLNINKKQG